MTTTALRKKVKDDIDIVDEKTLKRINAIIEGEDQYDFWYDLPEQAKNDVLEAKKQSDAGLGKTHEEVMKKYLK